MEKAHIIDALGESGLLLPTLLVTHDEADAAAAGGAVVAFPQASPPAATPNVVPLPGPRRRPA